MIATLQRAKTRAVTRVARYIFESALLHRLDERIAWHRTYMHLVFGDPARVALGENVEVNNAMLNVNSGTITIGDETYFGTGVSLLTGTHDPALRGAARRTTWPTEGRDIVIGSGVWIASNVTILGPCVIGDDAVVAAGALVTKDVPAGALVAGCPARVVKADVFS